jgi:hypothetical protein
LDPAAQDALVHCWQCTAQWCVKHFEQLTPKKCPQCRGVLWAPRNTTNTFFGLDVGFREDHTPAAQIDSDYNSFEQFGEMIGINHDDPPWLLNMKWGMLCFMVLFVCADLLFGINKNGIGAIHIKPQNE